MYILINVMYEINTTINISDRNSTLLLVGNINSIFGALGNRLHARKSG